jgi:hypothetical protein
MQAQGESLHRQETLNSDFSLAIASLLLLGTIRRRRFAAMDRQDCRSLRRAPRADGPLMCLASPGGEESGLSIFHDALAGNRNPYKRTSPKADRPRGW